MKLVEFIKQMADAGGRCPFKEHDTACAEGVLCLYRGQGAEPAKCENNDGEGIVCPLLYDVEWGRAFSDAGAAA